VKSLGELISRVSLMLALPVLFTGCATSPPAYDATARESSVRIVRKEIISTIVRNTAEVRPIIPIPIGPVFIFIRPGAGTGRVSIYQYEVEKKDKSVVRVFNEASGFEIGSCVVLFESDQPTYSRIAFGGNCD
jgi:hypothetical protein